MIRDAKQGLFGKLDPLITEHHVEVLTVDEKPFRFQFDLFPRIEHQNEVVLFQNVNNKEGSILVMKIDLFPKIRMVLLQKVTLLILSNA